jgi:hypothetical protein
MYNGNPKPATPPDMQAGDNVTVKVMANDVQSIDNRRSALRASLPLQVKAMFIKNLHFQKRRKWANCCLCILPVFFIAILVALQIIINRLLTSSGNFTCPDDPSTATNAQRTWCAIANPLSYPPLLKVSTANRAPSAFIYTGTNADALASKVTFSDADIDSKLTTRWGLLKPLLWKGLNASCNIDAFIPLAEFSTIMDTDCRVTGDMKDPVTGKSPAEFSATQWSQKAKGIQSSESPQVKLMIPKLGNYPGGLDAFSACASKGLSFLSIPEVMILGYAPIRESQLSMSTFARLSQRIYEDPAFAPSFLQGSASGEEGRFGNVA